MMKQDTTKVLRRTFEHIVKPAFKFWIKENGCSMDSFDQFIDQLFDPESKVQVIKHAYAYDHVDDSITLAISLGYVDPKSSKIIGEVTAMLILRAQ